jgi:Zn2+/Cd2+-exporting ATPase
VAMFFVWWLGVGLPAFQAGTAGQSAFYRTMTLLVVSSPCALVLSIPSAILSAIAYAARRGILFRGGAAVERLARINSVVMDKTGTLTTGELRVEQVESFPPGKEQEMLAVACALEALSTHPLARAVTAYGRKQGVKPVAVYEFESIAGAGLQGRVEGELVRLGKRSWVGTSREQSVPVDLHPGLAEVWVARDGVSARILLRDDLRPGAREVVARLRQLGLRTMLLTGDRPEPAQHVREATGIDEVRAGLRPEDKLRVLVSLKHRGERVAMIGDGVNDAPSLAAAEVGVAMGARGSDAALEQADIVLMNDRLENFLTALELSQRARRVIQQNLAISLGTVAVLAVLAAFGKIPLSVGVIGHEGSTVLVVMNSLRLLVRGAKPPSSRAAANAQACPPKET